MEPAGPQRTATIARAGRRRRSRKLVAVAAALALIAAGQEALFRWVFPLPEVGGFNRIHYQMVARSHPNVLADARRGLAYNRLRFESLPDGFSEVHRLNLYGFRGADFAIDPPRGRRRILVLGDSIVEGVGAPESGTITAELARLLARDGEDAEILNLGVLAATLPHLTALARDALAVLRPTDLVLVLYANDLPAPPYPRQFDRPGPRFPRRVARRWVPRVVELLVRVARKEPIDRRWPHATTPFFAPVPDPSNPWTGSSGPPAGLDATLYRAMVAGSINPWLKEQSDALPGMLSHRFDTGGSPERYLHRIDRWCRSVGARLTVAYVPFCGVTHPRYASSLVQLGMARATAERLAADPIYCRQDAMIAEVCARLGLPLADTTAALRRAEAGGVPQYWSFDTHPRPAGYATIAREIHPALVTAGRNRRPRPDP
ncbi:MAG TPA: hypothetical protein VG406_29580 [Isosphaeraceae bacterium]|nr:hypothetical protein [Isosphaeraceae bacterium]